MKNGVFYSIILFIFWPLICNANDWNDFIINYSKSLYGNGSQTWQIKTYGSRWAFFANQNGLVEFSGSSWRLFTLHNNGIVRSICPSLNRKKIYIGGINEFGYYTTNTNGKPTYVCLSEQMHGKQNLTGNVWNIFEYENVLYFIGDAMIVKYVNNKYSLIKANAKIDCSAICNGVLYLGTTAGISILVGNTLLPVQGASILQGKRIRSILPFGNNVLIVTAFDGIYSFDGQKTSHFVTGMEPFLKQNEIFCATISKDYLAVGSIRNGLSAVNLKTHQVKYFNEMCGMQNNTVLSVAFDLQGNLWAGLDSGGVDYILLKSQLTNLYSFPNSYGTGYSAYLNENILYLGTNRGLFYMPFNANISGKVPQISAIKGGGGQVWGINRIGNDIFCTHDRGLFLLQGTNLKKITNITGAWTCQAALGKSDRILVGVYDGLYVIKKTQGAWSICNKINDITESCRWFAQESPERLWITNGSSLWLYITNKELTRAKKVYTYNLHDLLKTEKGTKIYRVNGHILISTPKGLYEINSKRNKIELCKAIEKPQNSVTCLSLCHGSIITMASEHISIYDIKTGKERGNYFEIPHLPLVIDAETIIPITDSIMIIPNDNGFALFNRQKINETKEFDHILHIRNVYLTTPKDSLIYTDNFLSLKNKPQISFHRNSIRFEYGIAFPINIERTLYQYRLNKKEWSDYTSSKVKEFSNLHEGDYTFEVKAILPNGTSISMDSYSFRILPPWYRSIWAYMVYLILFIVLIRYLYILDDIRLRRKKQQAVKEKDRQIRIMEQEYEEEKAEKEKQIVELEKEKLEYDLKHKSQEMANLMINFVRKNEILTEIRSDLFKVLNSLKGENTKESKQMLILVRNKIESNIQGDEVLKKIEDQFDVIHNKFMQKLKEKHPNLSNNEWLMCAYLKMNLSTKEIAPLLNISVRGVETIRYRLRKKFNLEREDNLTEYLNNL